MKKYTGDCDYDNENDCCYSPNHVKQKFVLQKDARPKNNVAHFKQKENIILGKGFEINKDFSFDTDLTIDKVEPANCVYDRVRKLWYSPLKEECLKLFPNGCSKEDYAGCYFILKTTEC